MTDTGYDVRCDLARDGRVVDHEDVFPQRVVAGGVRLLRRPLAPHLLRGGLRRRRPLLRLREGVRRIDAVDGVGQLRHCERLHEVAARAEIGALRRLDHEPSIEPMAGHVVTNGMHDVRARCWCA